MKAVYRIRQGNTYRCCCFGCAMEMPAAGLTELTFIFLVVHEKAERALRDGSRCPRCNVECIENNPFPAHGEPISVWQAMVRKHASKRKGAKA